MTFRYKAEVCYDPGSYEPMLWCDVFYAKASSPKQALPRLRTELLLCGHSVASRKIKIKDVKLVVGEELDSILLEERDRCPY